MNTDTFCMLGKNRVGVDRLEWLTLRPAMPVLPHRSHLYDILVNRLIDWTMVLG